MDYVSIAEELLAIHSAINRLELNQRMDDYSKGELYALSLLYESSDLSYPKELSRSMQVSSARVAVLLNHLEKKGWVRRDPDTRDERKTVITLTDAGRDALLREKQTILDSLVTVLEKLGKEDAEEMLRIRKKFLRLSMQ